MNVDFPYDVDARGRTRETVDDEHVRDLVEQVLFTSQGERPNRMDFGTNLRQLVFGRATDEVAATVGFLVKGALQQWLGDLIQVDDVTAIAHESTLEVVVQYTVRRTQEAHTARFTAGGARG